MGGLRSKMTDLDEVDWRYLINSVIENPQKQIANFKELEEIAKRKEKYSKERIVFENEKYRLIFKIAWDKSKFFFRYEHVVINKESNEKNKRAGGVDEATHQKGRHLHSGNFVIPNPDTMLEKLEHPILSIIIKSENEERKEEWRRRLAIELKQLHITWREYLQYDN